MNNICQDCKKEPATYGDGLTWARCSNCQLKFIQAQTPSQTQSNQEGFEHKTISGLTSIIMPLCNVNYSLFHYTGTAIGSIREHTNKVNYELIILDNGSPIKPPTLQSYYADKVITNETNQGVTKAWNKGVRASFGEYIVLLNSDTQVYEGWLETLKEAIDSGETDLAMAHPMYSLTEPFARAVESRKVLEGKYIFDSLDRDFSCVMFKKELFDEIGGFDETFFNYCSDVDFLKRMEQAGKKFKMIDKVAIHHISDATGYSIPETPEIMNKDKAAYEEKWNRSTATEVQATLEQIQEIKEKREETFPQIKETRFIRTSETGDKVYFVNGNHINWVKDPKTFEQLGGKFGDEVEISKEEFSKYERGEPIGQYNIEKYA